MSVGGKLSDGRLVYFQVTETGGLQYEYQLAIDSKGQVEWSPWIDFLGDQGAGPLPLGGQVIAVGGVEDVKILYVEAHADGGPYWSGQAPGVKGNPPKWSKWSNHTPVFSVPIREGTWVGDLKTSPTIKGPGQQVYSPPDPGDPNPNPAPVDNKPGGPKEDTP